MVKKIFFLFAILLSFLNLTWAKDIKNHKDIPTVSVSIPPQAFFVEKIAGDTVKINIILPPNTNEHHFEFKPSVMKKLEQSEIYFTIGLEFEKIFIDKFHHNFPNLEIVNMQKNIKLLDFQDSHHQKDPHTWLDPVLVQTMALNIYDALIQKYPENKNLYKENLNKFLAELDNLNLQISSKLENIKQKEFIVYHPSWAYFAKRYHLIQIPVENLGKEPKIKELKQLITFIKDKHIKTIFVQNGFPENAAKTLAHQCDAQIYIINHLSKDWEKELLKVSDALSKALK
ncbi:MULTISPECIES: metal ABC transporter solute-binding protein, Zn/Mn family [Campylobacter]|uniref:ABC transporter substrate-binding protein n=1 Tax=Campylobacter taeniopygiae TaxID=2510188 RepID=A0ABY2TN14_9BACT|nr:zinc ABC transporter substrate-binding protein [Campylobacter taeniopygiae]MBZ7935878.1 zinc ABC transporter substrate-binding protein [Campylobacter sp. B0100352/1]MBZ7964399.1 zinc ABC transporter substrate-binding protein [Campylobacter sp. 2457A]TKX34029.1 ABC transporter substrate-binding protein [Campylobacter taeniopygiae]